MITNPGWRLTGLTGLLGLMGRREGGRGAPPGWRRRRFRLGGRAGPESDAPRSRRTEMAPRADAPGPAEPDRTAAPGGTAAPDPAGPDGLAGRVALVTGGSGGIGRVLSRRLAAAGAAVAVGYGQHAQ